MQYVNLLDVDFGPAIGSLRRVDQCRRFGGAWRLHIHSRSEEGELVFMCRRERGGVSCRCGTTATVDRVRLS
jgi:hypothetical protein